MTIIIRSLLAWLVLAVSPAAFAQQNLDNVEIKVEDVSDGLYMLVGQGGNIGVSTGPDGVFVIDDQYAPLSDKILAAIRSRQEGPVHFVINTHWHGDHTGGNEIFGGAGAVIVAHDNVRARMSVDQFMEAFGRRVPAAPRGALPVITFSDRLTFHWNGDEITAVHVASAHTDGDAIIHFRKANVVHMGDTYFSGTYPFIDTGSGGSIDGVISAAEIGLGFIDDDTSIIPGHGPLSRRSELMGYRDMLVSVRAAVQELIEAGMTRDEIIAAKPTAALDADWGGGFMQPDQWVGIVYDSLQN